MKKVVIDARCIFDSGVGVYLRELLQRLTKENITIELIINPEQLAPLELLMLCVEKVHIVNFGRLSIKNLFSLNKLIKHADIYLMPALAVSPINSKVEQVPVIHDICPIRMYKSFGYLVASAYWFILALQLFKAKTVIAISDFTKNEINAIYPAALTKKVEVIYNGLSTRLNESTNASQHTKPYLLCVGNIKPHKNIIGFVNYFSERSGYADTHSLVVVGQAEGFRTGINSPLSKNDNVEFTGFVSDEQLSDLYQNASAYIFPSFYEGFGLPLLEAMSFNLPILASNIPVFKEIAEDKIEYFDPNDFNDFDIKLTRLLKRSSADYSGILERYTWEKNVQAMMSIINR